MNKYLIVLFLVLILSQAKAQLYESGDKIGIGISSPVGKLDIKGVTYLRAAPTYNVVYEQLRIGRSDSDIRYHSLLSSHNGNAHQNFLKFLIHSGGMEAPFTDQSTVMTLLGNGNIGIGTETPDSKLTVNGNIRAHEIKLEATNWPDYVFGENYRQPGLEELEAFIKANGHLPGLKSAKEYQEVGVDILELNQKLLEKIEELTLYSIQLEKEVTSIKQENRDLKSNQTRVDALEKRLITIEKRLNK